MNHPAAIPNGWAAGTIASRLASIFPGEWGSDPSYGASVTFVLRSTNLDDEGHVDLTSGAARQIPLAKIATKELRPGDILLEASGGGPGKPVGRVALFEGGDQKYICSNFFRTLRPNSHVHSGFLSWRLLHLYKSPRIWNFQQQTTGLINLNIGDYLDQELAWPPLGEQVRIAEVLDTLDEAIRSVQTVLDKKSTALVGLLQVLFSPSGGGQVPTRRTALGDYPSTWKVVPLRECVRPDTIITYGIVQAGPHVPEGVPYIRTGDMSGDALAAEGLLRTATRIDQAYARSKVRTGEIVCAIRATVGKVLPVPPELDGANLTQGTARIAPAQDINPSFLLWAIRSPRVQREIGLTVKGTTFAEITLEALREIPIPRPRDREEQNKIAATLDGLDAEIRAERVQLNKLQTIKSGLTADLLTGRIRCSENGNR